MCPAHEIKLTDPFEYLQTKAAMEVVAGNLRPHDRAGYAGIQ